MGHRLLAASEHLGITDRAVQREERQRQGEQGDLVLAGLASPQGGEVALSSDTGFSGAVRVRYSEELVTVPPAVEDDSLSGRRIGAGDQGREPVGAHTFRLCDIFLGHGPRTHLGCSHIKLKSAAAI